MLVATGATAVVKHRLDDPAHRDRHLLAVLDIGDLALAQGVLHRRFDLGAGARQETLPVAEALALGVGPAVDNVHRLPSRPGIIAAYPALFTRMYHSTSRRT